MFLWMVLQAVDGSFRLPTAHMLGDALGQSRPRKFERGASAAMPLCPWDLRTMRRAVSPCGRIKRLGSGRAEHVPHVHRPRHRWVLVHPWFLSHPDGHALWALKEGVRAWALFYMGYPEGSGPLKDTASRWNMSRDGTPSEMRLDELVYPSGDNRYHVFEFRDADYGRRIRADLVAAAFAFEKAPSRATEVGQACCAVRYPPRCI